MVWELKIINRVSRGTRDTFVVDVTFINTMHSVTDGQLNRQLQYYASRRSYCVQQYDRLIKLKQK